MRSRRSIIALVVLVCALALSSYLFVRYWYKPTYDFLYTDNARINGAVVSVVAQNTGQVVRLPYDIGDEVKRLQRVVTLKVALPVGALSSNSTTQTHFYQNIPAPVSGIVADRLVDLGDTVSPGQPLLIIVDPNDIWVIANIDENNIHRVTPGQRVDIHVDATDETLLGRVVSIVPLTTSILQGTTAPSLVVATSTQDVPVKIVFEQKSNYRLYPGLSTEVTIYKK